MTTQIIDTYSLKNSATTDLQQTAAATTIQIKSEMALSINDQVIVANLNKEAANTSSDSPKIELRNPNPLVAPITPDTLKKLSETAIISSLFANENKGEVSIRHVDSNITEAAKNESTLSRIFNILVMMINLAQKSKETDRHSAATMTRLQGETVMNANKQMITSANNSMAMGFAQAAATGAGAFGVYKTQAKANKMDADVLKNDQVKIINHAQARDTSLEHLQVNNGPDRNIDPKHAPILDNTPSDQKKDLSLWKNDAEIHRNNANSVREKGYALNGINNGLQNLLTGVNRGVQGMDEAKQYMYTSVAQAFASLSDGAKNAVTAAESFLQALFQQMVKALDSNQNTVAQLVRA